MELVETTSMLGLRPGHEVGVQVAGDADEGLTKPHHCGHPSPVPWGLATQLMSSLRQPLKEKKNTSCKILPTSPLFKGRVLFTQLCTEYHSDHVRVKAIEQSVLQSKVNTPATHLSKDTWYLTSGNTARVKIRKDYSFPDLARKGHCKIHEPEGTGVCQQETELYSKSIHYYYLSYKSP
jgi:hypothetical protein